MPDSINGNILQCYMKISKQFSCYFEYKFRKIIATILYMFFMALAFFEILQIFYYQLLCDSCQQTLLGG